MMNQYSTYKEVDLPWLKKNTTALGDSPKQRNTERKNRCCGRELLQLYITVLDYKGSYSS